MIIEQALLQVKPGQSGQFVQAMQKARPLITAQPGFRKSPEYPRWRALLHEFYDPMPTVTYFGPSIFS